MKNENSVRVRFAPSPTGYLHVGGARTALFCYLFAKKHGGTFVLRVEDTDQERSTEESLRMQLGDLKWLGLSFDEGVDGDSLESFGETGPYRQSQRLSIYKEFADQLLQSGKAYYCFLTDEELEEQRKANETTGHQHVQSPYRDWDLERSRKELASGRKAVIRFKKTAGSKDYIFPDIVRGEVKFSSDMVGDFVLLRSDGMPVYNFCCVIDDALMKISHVLRAEEHLPNTLRQLMIYEALDFSVPQFAHMSLILGEDRQKLSKRHGATSVKDYSERGFLPEALVNFLALLGWSSPTGEEILSLQELEQQFDLSRLNAAPAVFDETKLRWMNAQYLRKLNDQDLWRRLQPFITKANLELEGDEAWRSKVLDTFRPRMETLVDAIASLQFLGSAFDMDESCSDVLAWPETAKVVQTWLSKLDSLSDDFLSADNFDAIQNLIKTDCQVKGKHLFMPLRVAIIGRAHGVDIKDIVPLVKRKFLVERARKVLAEIK